MFVQVVLCAVPNPIVPADNETEFAPTNVATDAGDKLFPVNVYKTMSSAFTEDTTNPKQRLSANPVDFIFIIELLFI